MIVTISQPRYLPWLGYFHRIGVSDVFVYLDTVQYTPRDWENRNKIKTDRGWTWLTVPVKARYLALIPEVTIDNDQPWQHKHWQSLRTFYSKAPYFRDYAERLEHLYLHQTWHHLTDFNLALTTALCDAFGMAKSRFIKASDLGVSGHATDLLVQICRALGATIYLSGCQGRNYLDEAAFAAHGIGVHYQDYAHPTYPQLYESFLPGMAAPDLLFNCGRDSARILLAGQAPIQPAAQKKAG
jgi:hypothetical protein